MCTHRGRRQGVGVLPAHPVDRKQVLHHRLRRQPPRAHLLLHPDGHLAHQTEVPRHPARAAAHTRSQCLAAQAVSLAQLAQQPPLLDRAQRRGLPLGAIHEQRLSLRHRPHHRQHRVPPQAAQGTDPPEAVDHDVATRLLRHRHHHDRHLLPDLRQRPQEPSLEITAPHAQPFVAQVELMKLQIHAALTAGHPMRPAPTAISVHSAGSGLFALPGELSALDPPAQALTP